MVNSFNVRFVTAGDYRNYGRLKSCLGCDENESHELHYIVKKFSVLMRNYICSRKDLM